MNERFRKRSTADGREEVVPDLEPRLNTIHDKSAEVEPNSPLEDQKTVRNVYPV